MVIVVSVISSIFSSKQLSSVKKNEVLLSSGFVFAEFRACERICPPDLSALVRSLGRILSAVGGEVVRRRPPYGMRVSTLVRCLRPPNSAPGDRNFSEFERNFPLP
jgi:hypothetical protein